MLPLQRKIQIFDAILSKSGATIKALSQQFNVSEMTVRRDLRQLEQEGKVTLTHGGAVPVEKVAQEPTWPDKLQANQEAKERIAAYAASRFVADESVIILEGGSTVAKMIPHFQSRQGLTVLTNGMVPLEMLREKEYATTTVLCSGGILRGASGTFVGPAAEAFFGQYHAKTVFLSALGFTKESGFTDPNLMDTQVKRAMIRSAAKVVMLLDSSKLGQTSFVTTAKLEEISALVTDAGIEKKWKDYFEKENVQLHII